MVRKTKSKIVKSKSTHPRTKVRGWLVLRVRWQKLFKEFKTLSRLTKKYLISSFKKSNKRKLKKFKKIVKIAPDKARQLQGLALMTLGVIAVGFWLNHWWNKNELERMNRESILKSQLAQIEEIDKAHPTKIFIEGYVDAPIMDGTLIGNTWTLSDTAAVYLTQSARPGAKGNVIIYGHNTRAMMGNIRALRGNEKIKLTLSDGSQKWYQVSEMHQVTPETIEFIQPTETEVLTLYTCAGFADRERFVVRAIPTTLVN